MPELLITIGIILILFTISLNSLSKTQLESTLEEYSAQLKSDIYQVQNLTINHVDSGVYFESDKFIFFYGTSYDPLNTNNVVTSLPSALRFAAINIPGNTLTFEKITGYVHNFIDPCNVVLREPATNNQKTISLNKLGVVEIN